MMTAGMPSDQVAPIPSGQNVSSHWRSVGTRDCRK